MLRFDLALSEAIVEAALTLLSIIYIECQK